MPNQRNFYIFGQNISFSMSPVIHTAAFEHHRLPYTYTIHETPTVDSLSDIISLPSFGGASVTMPHKIYINKFCNSISEHAKAIGAINTLLASSLSCGTRMIMGENTDWSGLVECLKVKAADIIESATTGLVIGAGGAARAALYALYQCGIKNIYLVNRTRSNADDVARHYAPLFSITVLSSLSEIAGYGISKPDVIIGTIAADRTCEEDFPDCLFAREKGVCVDMSYKPRMTPLLEKARAKKGWKTVTGVEVLLEQGFLQSELWLDLPAPKEVMIRELERHDQRMLEGGKL